MKRIVPFIIFAFLYHSVFPGNVDSLYQELDKAGTDTARISLLLKISSQFENEDPARSLSIVMEAYGLMKKTKYGPEDIKVKAKFYADAIRKSGAALFYLDGKDITLKHFLIDKKVRYLIGDTTEIVRSYRNLAFIYNDMQMRDTVFAMLDTAFDIAITGNKFALAADMLRRKGIYFEQYQEPDSAVKVYLRSIIFYGKANDKKTQGNLLNVIGNIYKFRSEYDTALVYYQKSLSSKEEINDSVGMSYAYIGIANVFINWGYYDKARENYQKCFDLSEKIKNKKGSSAALVGLANLYQREEKYLRAIDYYQKSLEIEQVLNNSEGIALAQLNMADVYTKLEMFSKAIGLYNEALILMEKDNNKVRTNLILYLIGNLYYQEREYDKAIYYFQRSLEVARGIDYNQTILADLIGLSNAWLEKKQFEKAYRYLLDHKILNDSLFSEEKMTQMTEMQEKYESEKKEKEILQKDLELSKNEKEAVFQKNIRNLLIAGFLLVIVFAVFVYRSYRQKKRANHVISEKNKLLEQANTEIIAQRDEIESQRDTVIHQKEQIEFIHEELTSSIRYAQRIQQAMLPSLDLLGEAGLDYFVFFKPRDIVSGDFYWVGRQENLLVIAVADCTGHGVPGAFMSMLGIAFLKEIVMKEYITQPALVLKKMRKEIVRSLKQEHGATQRDGMDIALCTIDLSTLELQFAGANNPLYIVTGCSSLVTGKLNQKPVTSNQQLIEIKPDKMPIGIHERMDAFTLQTHQLQKGDCIYLFSDGMADQFGGPAGKKFKYKPLKELLMVNGQQPMAAQRESIDKLFSEWKGALEQVDDVTIMGISIGKTYEVLTKK